MGKTAAVAFVPDSESPCLLSRLCKSTVYQEAFFVGGRPPGSSRMDSLLPRVLWWGGGRGPCRYVGNTKKGGP